MMNARTIHILTRETERTFIKKQFAFGFRWMHTKHFHGAKHKSQKQRSTKRKAAQKAKNRR